MVNEFKIGYLYYHHKYFPDAIHLCTEVDEANDRVHFKHISGEFNWIYYDKEEKLWCVGVFYAKLHMIEIGPDCKVVRAIYL